MDPNDTDDLDLEAALEALRAQRVAGQEVDPETRALMARADVRAAMAERRRIEEMPDPEAPRAVEVDGSAGAVLVQAEAAATYVGPVEVAVKEAPRMPSGAVRIKTEMDPRRAKTAPALPVKANVTAAAGEEAAVGEVAVVDETPRREGAPVVPVVLRRAASREGASRPAKERRGRGVVIGAAIVFVAGAVTMLASVRGPERDVRGGVTMGEGAGRAAPGSAGGTSAPNGAVTSPGAPAGSSVTAMGTSVVMSGGGAPSASTAKTGAPRPSSSLLPDDDPYADAASRTVGAVPSTSVSSTSPTQVPLVTTSTAPSAAVQTPSLGRISGSNEQ